MTFLAPLLLIGLLLVPVLLGLYVWAQRRRSRYAVRFTKRSRVLHERRA